MKYFFIEKFSVMMTVQTISSQKEKTPLEFLQSFMHVDESDAPDTPFSELQKYLDDRVTTRVSDLKSWWFKRRLVYPNLFKLFVRTSCIPGSSASSERDFSLTGNIITEKRSTILPSNVNDLVVARNYI